MGEDRDADARVGEDLVAIEIERRRQGIDDAIRYGGSVVRRRDLAQEQRELVSAQPRDRRIALAGARARHGVARAHTALESFCHLCEQAVARAVAEGVVHAFEVIEIEEEKRHQAAVTSRGVESGFESFEEEAAVRKAREAVVERQGANLFLGADAVGDVERQREYRAHPPVRAAHRGVVNVVHVFAGGERHGLLRALTLSGVEDQLHDVASVLRLVLGEHVRQSGAVDTLAIQPVAFGSGRGDEGGQDGRVPVEENDRRLLERGHEGPEDVLALRELLLASAQRRDVVEGDDRAGHPIVDA